MFNIQHSFDHHFVELLDRLEKKYGEEMFELEGIDRKNLDIAKFTEKYLNTDVVADTSVDANANVDSNDVLGLEYEAPKPIMKLNGIYMLWKDALKKFGIKRANKMVELEIAGGIRVHDLHGWIKPYCWGTSLSTIVNEGMPWVKRIKIGPIKHFYSFINNTFQLICTLSTQCMGAVAVPDFLIYAEYFIRKDFGDKWYENEKTVHFIREAFQHFIYSVNNSFRGNQSPFTNVSVYDKYWLEALFKDHMNPDFTHPDIKNTMRVQKLFVDELMTQLQDNPFTFPVMTAASLLDPKTREFKDQEWLDWLSEVSVKNKCLNFFQDDSTSSISSCLSGNEVIKVQDSTTNGIALMTIKSFVEMFQIDEGGVDKEIEKRYFIQSYNYVDSKWETLPITGVVKKLYSGDLIEINIDGKSVKVTPEHKFTVHKIDTDEILEVEAAEIYKNPDNFEIGVE